MLSSPLFQVFIVGIAICASFYGYKTYVGKEPAPSSDWENAVNGIGAKKIPIIEWSAEALKEAIRNNTPVIFINSPALDWAATRTWNVQYLAPRIRELEKVQLCKYSRHDTYTYEVTDAPLGQILPKVSYKSNYAPNTMSSIEFFTTMVNRSDPNWVYYAGSLTQSDGKRPKVLLDMGDPSELGLSKALKDLGRGPAKSRPETIYVWMGKPGVKAHGHFDRSHNLFLQIAGYKRFILFPPSSLDALKMYPQIHPRKGQTRFDLEKPESPSDALHESLYHTMVEPGDILYIPPMWVHHVTAYNSEMGPPVSVSMWTKSLVETVDRDLRDLKLPLGVDWPLYLRWGGVYGIILTFLSTIMPSGEESICRRRLKNGEVPALTKECVDGALEIIKELKYSRYEGLLDEEPSEGAHEYKCVVNPGEGFVMVDPKGNGYEEFVTLEKHNYVEMRDIAVSVSDLLMSLHPHERTVTALDFIEETLLAALGIENVLDSILAMPESCPLRKVSKTHAIPPSA
mmetsp:Transcript_18117/g.27175  ORF Transcript_18117/g.27175 Transcript_18117/m.27175 type:complete len:513 (+) Transcript_18117:139-1677(+)